MISPSPSVTVGLGVLGLLVGRLLNLLIDRLPAGGRLEGAWPRCACCSLPLPPVAHLPVVGYLMQWGRCAACGARISWRVPVVDLLTGVLFAYVGYRWGLSAGGGVALLYISILLVTAAIDLERQLILNSVVYPAALAALALAPWGPPSGDAVGWRAYVSALEGGALAFGLLLLIYAVSYLLMRRQGVGEGDVKLGAFLGLALGFRGSLVALYVFFLAGGLWAIMLLASRRKGLHDVIPYGVWMAFGAIVSLFWGQAILDWYRGLFGF